MKKVTEAATLIGRRKHRTEQQWQTILNAHAQSGLSQEAFCQREGVSTGSLTNWRRRLRGEARPTTAGGEAPPSFIELANPVRPLDAGIKVRIELGAGVVLELSRA